MTTDKHIIATFTPQRMSEDRDYAYDIEGADRELDVTEKILAMPLSEIHALRDDQYNTDDLVEHEHDGPFKVEVVHSILEFFGVSNLNDVTQPMLTEASNDHARDNSSRAKKKPVTVLIACFNGAGEADIAVVGPVVTEEEAGNGEQYEKAKAMAKEEGICRHTSRST